MLTFEEIHSVLDPVISEAFKKQIFDAENLWYTITENSKAISYHIPFLFNDLKEKCFIVVVHKHNDHVNYDIFEALYELIPFFSSTQKNRITKHDIKVMNSIKVDHEEHDRHTEVIAEFIQKNIPGIYCVGEDEDIMVKPGEQ